MKKNFAKRILSLLVVLSLMLGASAALAEDAPKYGGSLNATINSDPGSLDMMLETNEQAQMPGAHIFETILSVDLAGQAHTGVCAYEQSEDGMTLTLTLREGLKFHSGEAVTIEDVKATLDRWFANVSGARKNIQDRAESIEVSGNAIVIKFSKPAPLALMYLSNYAQGPYVMPKAILEAAGSDKIKEYVGTGPYKFVEWQPDRYIKVEKFADYVPTTEEATGLAAPKMAYLDTIFFIPVKDKMTRITGVQTGSYDIAIGVPSNLYPSMAADKNVSLHMRDLAITPGMVFNYTTGATADVKVRQAILACLNMEDLMLAAEGDPNFYYLSSDFMALASRFHNDAGADKYNHPDLDKAKALLAESSYNGEKLVYLTTKDYDYFYTTALLAADMMRKIGIDVELQVVDNATLNDLRDQPDQYSIFSCGLTAKDDPTQIAFIASDTWGGDYASEGKTELLNRLSTTPGDAERIAIWAEFGELLYEEVPVITFGERRNCVIAQNNVHNIFEGTRKFYWNTWVD